MNIIHSKKIIFIGRKFTGSYIVGSSQCKRSIGFFLSSKPIESLPSIHLVEVGPRDGLQNERGIISFETKVQLIHKLIKSGIKRIEIGSFVSPKWVPQMKDTEDVVKLLKSTVTEDEFNKFSVLTPNMQGLEKAIELGVKEVAVFGSATELFSQKNINCSIDESLERFKEVCKVAKAHDMRIRGYVSCVLGCPYEGVSVNENKVSYVTGKLLDMGCYEVSLGDTIGTGNAGSTDRLVTHILRGFPKSKVAVHFHDTYGQVISIL